MFDRSMYPNHTEIWEKKVSQLPFLLFSVMVAHGLSRENPYYLK